MREVCDLFFGGQRYGTCAIVHSEREKALVRLVALEVYEAIKERVDLDGKEVVLRFHADTAQDS